MNYMSLGELGGEPMRLKFECRELGDGLIVAGMQRRP